MGHIPEIAKTLLADIDRPAAGLLPDDEYVDEDEDIGDYCMVSMRDDGRIKIIISDNSEWGAYANLTPSQAEKLIRGLRVMLTFSRRYQNEIESE